MIYVITNLSLKICNSSNKQDVNSKPFI